MITQHIKILRALLHTNGHIRVHCREYHKPSHTFKLVEAEIKVADHSGTGKLPRSRRQVSDVCKKLFSTKDTDDFAVMMERRKYTKTGQSPLVRAVQAAPQPLCV